MPPIKSTAPVEHLRSELPQLTRVGSSDPINDISSIVVVHLLLERTVQVTVVRHNSDVDNQDHTIDLGHQIRFPLANSSRYYWFPNYRLSLCFRFGNKVVKNRVMPCTPQKVSPRTALTDVSKRTLRVTYCITHCRCGTSTPSTPFLCRE